MKRTALAIGAVIALVFVAPTAAADKTHQQLMAEIRMMQEQQQQLQQMLGGLADTLKIVMTRIDEQSGASRKAFADQKLLIDNMAETVRILREKADDTNVRLSSMTQELQALRQTIASMPQPAPPPPPGTEPAAGDPTAPPVVPVPRPSSSVPPGVSPERTFNESFGDYTAGDYELAIEGFQSFIRMFPTDHRADDAQLRIGDSLVGLKRYQDAVAAFQKVVSDYPQSDGVAAAYYKMGGAYDALKQTDLARKAFETVIKNHPASTEAILAKQNLDRLNRNR
jgi:tol-pal system protein YbgF